MTENPPRAGARFYGRRQGRPLHVRKAQLMRDYLPKVCIDLEAGAKLNPAKLFTNKVDDIWLEIGFGGGEHIAAHAERHTANGFIGCEPFRNGVASLLDHIEARGIGNIRIFPDDARVLLDALPDHSIARIYVLFADPWPKKRHAERRFIGPENLPRLARVLKAGGELRLATDDTRLAAWILSHMQAAQDFSEIYHATTPPGDWVATRYEGKAFAVGRTPVYLAYRCR